MTSTQITALMNTAIQAYYDAPGGRNAVVFEWCGYRFRVRQTTFRFLVDTIGGAPVACRWH
jgi:hypothetical protein